MALNITTIRKQGITQITTKQECQFTEYGNPPYLSANPKRGDYYSPRTDNPDYIIPAGTVLKVVECTDHKMYTPPGGWHGILVTDPTGQSFRIAPSDVGKTCQ